MFLNFKEMISIDTWLPLLYQIIYMNKVGHLVMALLKTQSKFSRNTYDSYNKDT